MRRLCIVFSGTIMLPLLAMAPASATSTAVSNQLSGAFVGTTVFNATPPCAFFGQIFDGTYASVRGAGTFHLDGCVSFGPAAAYTYSGNFTLTSPKHATLTGSVNGVVGGSTPAGCASGLPASLDFTLTTTGGTKQLRHAVGSLRLSGVWCSPAVPGVAGPIDGTLTAALAKH